MSKKITVLALTVAISGLLVLSTNMRTLNSDTLTPDQILRSSKKFSNRINDPQTSQKLKVLYKQAKIQVLNYYAAKVNIASCSTLLEHDPTMLTGVYNLYPKGQLKAFLCEIANGQLIKATNLGLSPVSMRCAKTNTCTKASAFFKKFSCASTNGSNKSYCSVDGVFGTPALVKAENDLCIDTNYGYDDSGFWVKNGCSGKFAMNKVVSTAERMPLYKWPYRGDVIEYRLDVRYEKEGQQITKEKCVRLSQAKAPSFYNDARFGEAQHEFIFSGICDDKTSVNLKGNLTTRLCFSPGGKWQYVYCTPYGKGPDFWVPPVENIGNVIGGVDSANVVGTNLVVSGWACHVGDPGPVSIHMYHRNHWGQRGYTWLGQGTANRTHPLGAGIDVKCVSGGTSHRFEAVVPLPGKNIPSGSPIWVYGISRIPGKFNATLGGGNGVFKVPQYAGTPPLCVPSTVRCDPFDQNTHRSFDHLGCEIITCTQKRNGSDR
jgi:hypothetical protein